MTLIVALLFGLLAIQASAQQRGCLPYADLARELEKCCQERPRVWALRANGNMLIVFARMDDSTYTIASVAPNGTACILDDGTDWTVEQQPGRGAAR